MEILLSLVAVFALHCRFEIFVGSFPDSALLNGMHKLYGTFYGPEYTDLFVFAAVFIMLRFVKKKDDKPDIGSLLFSLFLSVMLVASISFKKFDSADFLFENSYQFMISCFCIIGICIMWSDVSIICSIKTLWSRQRQKRMAFCLYWTSIFC